MIKILEARNWIFVDNANDTSQFHWFVIFVIVTPYTTFLSDLYCGLIHGRAIASCNSEVAYKEVKFIPLFRKYRIIE